jgi:hypothetical protein
MFYIALLEEFENRMNWAEAIERNAAVLVRILAGLLASAGYADGSVAARLPGPIYRAALRVLRPMESAVRRLIVIAARDVVVKPAPVRPWVEGRTITRKAGGGGRVSFQLFDPRKRFDFKPRKKRGAARSGPFVWSVDPDPPPVSVYLETGSGWGPVPFPLRQPVPAPVPAPAPAPVPVSDGTVSALRLGRRLAAIKKALEDIPRQAIRLKRWEARRERIKLLRPATIASPLRAGRPPGLRKKPKDEVEQILKECHELAFEAQKQDTS